MIALLCFASEDDRRDLASLLGSLDVAVVAAGDSVEALDLTRQRSFELILMDLDADPDWRCMLEAFRVHAPAACVLVYSRLPEERLWLDAMDAGAFDFLCKPFHGPEVSWVFENALKAHRVAA